MSDTIIAALITGLISLISGFISRYQYCLKKTTKKNQKQKAGKSSVQIQIGDVNERK